jgi:uncharacterized membrane protein YbhN (UPF0104 family)
MGELRRETKGEWSWRIRVLGTTLSIFLLAWLLWQQDWQVILEAIQGISIWIMLAIFLLLIIRHVFNTIRWLILVRAQGIPLSFMRAIQLVFSGLFISNFLPSMVGGDVVRIAGLFQGTEKRVAAAASVVVDRLVGAFGMLFVLPFSTPLLSLILSEGLMVGGFVGVNKDSWIHRIRAGIDKVLASLKIWFNKPGWLFLALCASWLSVFTYLVGVFLLAREIAIPVSLRDVAGAAALTYFITIIPLSINGYGIRELVILMFYTHFGATTEQATLLALVTRIMFLVVSLPGAFSVGAVVQSKSKIVGEPVEDIE